MGWIVDCGGTKADWIDLTSDKHIKTLGWNSATATNDFVSAQIKKVKETLGNKVDVLHFYGAGCSGERANWIKDLFTSELKCQVFVESDLVAAARATCGHNEGIACILGTGSNSCKWNGEKTTEHTSPLGYILGDEGSGAVIGKKLVSDYLKQQLNEEIRGAFEMEYGTISEEMAIKKVYRESGGNRWLASFAPFLKNHLDDCYCYNLICDELVSFIERNVLQYNGSKELLVNFVGGIANGFSEVLEVAAEETGIHIGLIVESPIEGLLRWHKGL